MRLPAGSLQRRRHPIAVLLRHALLFGAAGVGGCDSVKSVARKVGNESRRLDIASISAPRPPGDELVLRAARSIVGGDRLEISMPCGFEPSGRLHTDRESIVARGQFNSERHYWPFRVQEIGRFECTAFGAHTGTAFTYLLVVDLATNDFGEWTVVDSDVESRSLNPLSSFPAPLQDGRHATGDNRLIDIADRPIHAEIPLTYGDGWYFGGMSAGGPDTIVLHVHVTKEHPSFWISSGSVPDSTTSPAAFAEDLFGRASRRDARVDEALVSLALRATDGSLVAFSRQYDATTYRERGKEHTLKATGVPPGEYLLTVFRVRGHGRFSLRYFGGFDGD